MKTILNLIFSYNYENISVIVAIIYLLLSIITTIHILLKKRDIGSSIAWIALVFLSPFIGTIAYIIFGINRISRKAKFLDTPTIIGNKFLKTNRQALLENISPHLKNMIVYGQSVYQQEFLPSNSFCPLLNGVNAYPQMIKAISQAKKEVLVESYIFEADDTTSKFLDAFKQAVSNGAAVKVLVDGFGSLNFFRRNIEKELAKIKGLEYGVFLPPLIPISLPFVNLRDHRKFIIVDGTIAFFGGMNLSKYNVLIDNMKEGILDITFKITGPVISQISQIFCEDWFFVKNKRFDACQSPVQQNNKPIYARVVPNAPDNLQRRTEFLICGALNCAQKNINIVTPYFLPDTNILNCLQMAAMRGVDVEIIFPQKNDHKLFYYAQESNIENLLRFGIKIYKQFPPFDHSKIFVVDGEWSFIGSSNWDVRSFRLNFEANMEIFSSQFAQELLEIIKLKKDKSLPVSLLHYQNIPTLKRLRNNIARLGTPYF
ncbi:MAG: phospholipase D-like domain-containing protein [Elusimicrobiota bacterium]|jgi:cardiolipin synthase|nr:phospholipase D-like domain-containing protein [Elusimicrobiota bacterium]